MTRCGPQAGTARCLLCWVNSIVLQAGPFSPAQIIRYDCQFQSAPLVNRHSHTIIINATNVSSTSVSSHQSWLMRRHAGKQEHVHAQLPDVHLAVESAKNKNFGFVKAELPVSSKFRQKLTIACLGVTTIRIATFMVVLAII